MGSFITLTASDGHSFQAWESRPSGTPRGAVIVIQEIFGVNSHIRSVTDAYAADGYLAIAPALFERTHRGYETGYAPDDIQAGIEVMQGLDMGNTLRDVAATVARVQGAGKVGILGYCWGGTVAWVAAARVAGLACSIPYYGGGIPSFIGEKPQCPVMFQFGEEDTMPSLQQAREIAAAHPGATANFYAAGHGFNCDQRGSYNAQASQLARTRTLEFLARHVG